MAGRMADRGTTPGDDLVGLWTADRRQALFLSEDDEVFEEEDFSEDVDDFEEDLSLDDDELELSLDDELSDDELSEEEDGAFEVLEAPLDA